MYSLVDDLAPYGHILKWYYLSTEPTAGDRVKIKAVLCFNWNADRALAGQCVTAALDSMYCQMEDDCLALAERRGETGRNWGYYCEVHYADN